MGVEGRSKRRGVPGCSRIPPPAVGDERVESTETEGGQSPAEAYKRRKTGIQLLNARTDVVETSCVRATCSSSMSKVCDVFATFDAEKRGLIEDIGFGGMLSLPRNTDVDPRFSLWLMRNVETSDRPGLCLHTRNVDGLICRDIDVHLLLGVPFEGSEIALGESVSVKIVRVLRKLLLISVCSFPITTAEVQEVLVKRYGSGMSYVQRASFKIAVVLFAVTHFLAPNCCAREFANTEIFKHILDPDKLKNVNWAGYFIKCIKRESARLKDELTTGVRSVAIHGCPTILKVFYLDNMEFQERSPVHDVFPRITAYTSELMCLLVASDTKKDYMSSLDMYGISKVRDKSDVCYSRGFASRSVIKVVKPAERMVNHVEASASAITFTSSDLQDMIHFGLKLIDEHDNACSELLKGLVGEKQLVGELVDHMRSQWISYSIRQQEARMQEVEDAPRLHSLGNHPNVDVGESSSIGGAANWKKMGELKVESGKLVFKPVDADNVLIGSTGSQDFHKLEPKDENAQSAGVSVLMPAEKGLYFTPAEPVSNGGEFFEQLDEVMQRGGVSVLAPDERAFYATPADPVGLGGPPVFDATPEHATTGRAPTGWVFDNCNIESDEETDEPELPGQIDCIHLTSHSVFGASPFSLGLFHAKTPSSVCRFLQKMLDKSDAVEARRMWFCHNEPTVLTLSCLDLRCAFYKEGRFTVIVVDGLSRLFTDLDRQMYRTSGILDNMWRHWMPASFVVAVMDGQDWLVPKFRDMFIGEHLGYSVANCRMVIMPYPKNGRWSTYVWDFMEKVITVLDPYLQGTSVGKMEWEHDDTMHCLHDALFQCKSAWMQGWEVDRHNWRYNHPIALGRRCRDYNTGVYALHYALHFDGDCVTDLSVEDDHAIVRSDMLHKMLTTTSNTGDIPSFVARETA